MTSGPKGGQTIWQTLNDKTMKNILWVVLFGMLLTTSGCCRKLIPSASENVRDSVRVEYREIIREVEVPIEIPVEKLVNVVPADSTSFLQTTLARSEAGIKNGLLWHNLENRQDTKPTVTIPVKDTEKEEVKVREVEKIVPYPVETPLTKWQKFRMDIGGWTLAALLGIIAWIIIKKFVLKR